MNNDWTIFLFVFPCIVSWEFVIERMCWSRDKYSSCWDDCPWKLCIYVQLTSKWYCISSLATCSTLYWFYTTDLFTSSGLSRQKLWWFNIDGNRIWKNRKWYALCTVHTNQLFWRILPTNWLIWLCHSFFSITKWSQTKIGIEWF